MFFFVARHHASLMSGNVVPPTSMFGFHTLRNRLWLLILELRKGDSYNSWHNSGHTVNRSYVSFHTVLFFKFRYGYINYLYIKCQVEFYKKRARTGFCAGRFCYELIRMRSILPRVDGWTEFGHLALPPFCDSPYVSFVEALI